MSDTPGPWRTTAEVVMDNHELRKKGDQLRRHLREALTLVEDLRWSIFAHCIDMKDGWKLPSISDQHEACVYLEEIGWLEKHKNMLWWRRLDGVGESKCPTCDSPSPRKHPAVQHEGEVQLCSDPWHKRLDAGQGKP